MLLMCKNGFHKFGKKNDKNINCKNSSLSKQNRQLYLQQQKQDWKQGTGSPLKLKQKAASNNINIH